MTGYFPVALDLRGRRCVVVGGGQVAERKVGSLLAAGAQDILVVAPEISDEIASREVQPGLEVRRRAFEPSDLDHAFLAMVVTSDPSVNRQIAAEARARGVLVNVADDPGECDFILPAVVRRGDLEIAITTGGQSPAFARFMRELLEELVPPEYGGLLDISAAIRAEVRAGGAGIDPDTWQRALRGEALEHVRQGELDAAAEAIRRALGVARSGPAEQSGVERSPARPAGCVALVGAGPGDPGLITVAGQRAIAEADVVVYDRLVNDALLALTRPNARLIYAGKGPRGDGPMTQEEINTFICDEALGGRRVVRLKGGDPFVFARGGEEALAAVRAGVPFRVIPGVTAAVAAPAYAGIPLTHRGVSSAFTVVTGQQGPTGPPIDWAALARLGGTLVLLMGVEPLPEIVAELTEGGLAPSTPAAVIEWGTLPRQRVVAGALCDIAELARAAGLGSPATTVVGAVAGLADELAWFPPLQVAPTRA